MGRPGRQSARAAPRGRLSRLLTAAAQPFGSIRTQIVLLVVMASLLISLLATWVSTAALEDFLNTRLESRFPALLAAKAREVRLWYDQVGLDLKAIARHPAMQRNLAPVLRGEDGRARHDLHLHLLRALVRHNRYAALVLCSPATCPLIAVGFETEGAARPLPPSRELGRARAHGIVRREGERRQLLSLPISSFIGVSLRALVDLQALDRLLATGITRPAVDLYVVDAAGRYIAGTLEMPHESWRYRGPGPDTPAPIRIYDNDRGDEVIGAAQPVGRFGWTLVIEQNHAATMAPMRALVAEVFRIVFLLALLLALVAVALALSVVRPLEALSAAADRVADDRPETHLPRPRGAREVRRLTRAFNEMTRRLGANRRELERRAEELEQLSITDGLTGLYNHRHFQEQRPLEAKRAERAGLSLALILVDIDDFKAINDTFGHAVGDGVLCAVAQVMTAEVRAIDVVARYGGEEFAVLTQQRDERGAIALADKIRRAIAAIECELPPAREGPAAAAGILQLTASAGVGLHAAGADSDEVFDAADAALYAAKLAGKNRVELGRHATPIHRRRR